MDILIVGNILKDVYLNLDPRKDQYETDKHGVKWLDIAFNTSEHRFFNRHSSFGGSAVSLEVLEKLGLNPSIIGSVFNLTEDGPNTNQSANIYRYILLLDDQVSYFAPSNQPSTNFPTPDKSYDYLFIDRSAKLNTKSTTNINSYLDTNPNTKLVLYLQNLKNPYLNQLLPRADLVFSEENSKEANLVPEKTIFISEKCFSYLDISENVSLERVDILTHLSFYSIATATILGCFILGYSVEKSFKMARLNVENANLDSSLSLKQLNELSREIPPSSNLELIAKNLVLSPKGILAADESANSIHKRFEALNIEDTYNNRRDYRNLLFTTPNLEKYLNGVILFDETARQTANDGQNFVDYLTSCRIIPGIKVDQGLEKFENSQETYTRGLENLANRLQEYYQMGLRFAKWRSAFSVTPSDEAINKNCEILAEYAKECQNTGFVPIVEPELLYDGDYDIETSANCTAQILDCLFTKLTEQSINLRACILKVNMVLAGKQFKTQSTPEEVGIKTTEVLKKHVPAELAGVVFLSGGQTPEQATNNLAEIIKHGPFPWPVTFSFARALQAPVLEAWQGKNSNKKPAQDAFLDRLEKNQEALKS